MSRLAAVLAAGAVLSGCAASGHLSAEQPANVDWRRVATQADRSRLRNWRQAWVAAIATVRQRGGNAALGSEPRLFDPDRALAGAALAAGSYRCRRWKLASHDPALKPVAMGGWAPCTVAPEGSAVRFAAQGLQRAEGYLFDDTDARRVFLGTLALGDETRALRYGRDARRDMAGVLERVDERRWRLVLPYPGFESMLDVIEIVPATGG